MFETYRLSFFSAVAHDSEHEGCDEQDVKVIEHQNLSYHKDNKHLDWNVNKFELKSSETIESLGDHKITADTEHKGLFHHKGYFIHENVKPTDKFEIRSPILAAEYLSLSDKRLKEEIEPIADAIELITQLQGVKFKWIKSGLTSYGLIAQDAQKVIKEIVNYDENQDLYSVNYQMIIGLLIESIKNLDNRLKKIEDKL